MERRKISGRGSTDWVTTTVYVAMRNLTEEQAHRVLGTVCFANTGWCHCCRKTIHVAKVARQILRCHTSLGRTSTQPVNKTVYVATRCPAEGLRPGQWKLSMLPGSIRQREHLPLGQYYKILGLVILQESTFFAAVLCPSVLLAAPKRFRILMGIS